jgi:hypothetical protein
VVRGGEGDGGEGDEGERACSPATAPATFTPPHACTPCARLMLVHSPPPCYCPCHVYTSLCLFVPPVLALCSFIPPRTCLMFIHPPSALICTPPPTLVCTPIATVPACCCHSYSRCCCHCSCCWCPQPLLQQLVVVLVVLWQQPLLRLLLLALLPPPLLLPLLLLKKNMNMFCPPHTRLYPPHLFIRLVLVCPPLHLFVPPACASCSFVPSHSFIHPALILICPCTHLCPHARSFPPRSFVPSCLSCGRCWSCPTHSYPGGGGTRVLVAVSFAPELLVLLLS